MKTLRIVLTVFCALTMLTLSACQKKQKADGSAEGTAPISDEAIAGDLADSDTGNAAGLQTVHYAYDSAVLDAAAKTTLKNNASLLKEKASLRVQIEGHTDERGGIQYNIALGERRANAARAFLIGQGVTGDRLTIISYGKERPVDQGHDESAWGKNRRANFRVTEK